ncbi:MAG: hypothetical protein RJQ07_07445 [Pseudomonadales bacterium]
MAVYDAWLGRMKGWLSGSRGAGQAPACVYVSRSAVAVVRAGDALGRQAVVRADPLSDLADLSDVLREQLRSLQVMGMNCNLVLAPEFYALQLMEKPEVPDAELKEAVRWKLQDQVEFSVENAVLDVFPMPYGASRHGHMIFAVVMPLELLRLIVTAVVDAGVKRIDAIDISELTLRNLSWRCFPQADQSVGLLRLTANSGLVNVSRGDDLYLSRRISGVPADFDESAWGEFRERLLVQVQRSLDYYQSAMGQPACDMLMVACTDSWTSRVTEYLTEMLPMPVRSVHEALAGEFAIRLHNPTPADVDWDTITAEQTDALAASIPALGGILRAQIDTQGVAA